MDCKLLRENPYRREKWLKSGTIKCLTQKYPVCSIGTKIILTAGMGWACNVWIASYWGKIHTYRRENSLSLVPENVQPRNILSAPLVPKWCWQQEWVRLVKYGLQAIEGKSIQKGKMAKVWCMKFFNPWISCLLPWYQNNFDSRNGLGL
jgi:hypothetical protein